MKKSSSSAIVFQLHILWLLDVFLLICFTSPAVRAAPQQRPSLPLGGITDDLLSTMLAQFMPVLASAAPNQNLVPNPMPEEKPQENGHHDTASKHVNWNSRASPNKIFDGQSNDKLLRLAIDIAGPFWTSLQRSFSAPSAAGEGSEATGSEGLMATVLSTLKRPDVFQNINRFMSTLVNEHVRPALETEASLLAAKNYHSAPQPPQTSANRKKPDKLQYEPTPPTVNEYPLSELNKMASEIEFLFKNSNPLQRGVRQHSYERQPIDAPPVL